MRLHTRTLTTLSVGGLALIAAFMLLLGNFSASPRADAANDGSLAGTYDIVLSSGPTSLIHCIAKIDHDMTSGGLTVSTVCYADFGLGDPNGEPPFLPAEGPNGLAGPPPPPPYSAGVPQVGSGSVAGGAATFSVCFSDTGGSSAPNIITTVSIPFAKTDIAAGVMSGTLTAYWNQPDGVCATDGPPVGAPFASGLPILFYRVADKVPTGQSGGTGGCDDSPLAGRSTHCTDYDADGCTDQDELLNTGATACGDDPYNPYDSSIADLDGTYYTLATLAGESCGSGEPATACPFGAGAPDPAPGAYFHCISSLNYISSSNIHNRIYCYTDIQGAQVNPQGYPGCSGDGFPGASPPGRVSSTFYASACSQVLWGGMGTMHTDLSGSLAGSTLTTTGCFADLYGTSIFGNVYVSGSQNAYTGVGTVSIYPAQTLPNCVGGTPAGSPTAATLQAARQSSNFSRDTDGDGCTDAQELQDTTLRDPFNRWDGYDVNGDGVVNVFGDILGVLSKVGLSTGDPGYVAAYDRGGPITGAHPWNLREPDGVISAADVLQVTALYASTCNSSVAGDPGELINILTLEGALDINGSKASVLSGERLRWTCYAGSGDSVTIRFHYIWGNDDVNGTGTTSFTHNPSVELQSVECLVNSSPIGTITINWVLIDPSGTVYDSISSASIPGATVALEYNDGGTWRELDENVPADQARMNPDINPQTTGLTGRYGWDVAMGQYRVQVSKSGCTSNSGGPVNIPPPVTNLDVGIVCGDPDGDGLPTAFETSSAGGTHTNPSLFDTDGDTTPDGAEDCDADSLTNLVEVTIYGSDPCTSDNLDSDLDGCNNIEELGPNPELGGDRDTGNFWDFFDVWTRPVGNPTGWERDQNVGLFGDIFQVAGRFGAAGNPFTDPLTPPAPANNTGYHPAYDRSPPQGDPWHVSRGDGTIDLFNDIFGVAYQFGHDCGSPP